MPAEAARFERRLGRRDWRLLGALAAAALVGTPLAIVATARSSDPARPSSCITYAAAGVMGGGAWHLCGARARTFCATHEREAQCQTPEPNSPKAN
jgi:hypothetical protein